MATTRAGKNTPPTGVAILGMGYLGYPLALALDKLAIPVLAAHKQPNSKDRQVNFPVQHFDLKEISRIDFSLWANYKTWVCLLPPSCSEAYVEAINYWIAQAENLAISHLVYTSSISVYGSSALICNEHSAIHPETENAKKISQIENTLLTSQIKQIDILRLAGLYSLDRHPLRYLSAKGKISDANKKMNLISQNQAVKALLLAIQQANQIRIRNIVQKHHPTRQEFLIDQAQQLGLTIPEFESSTNNTKYRIIETIYDDFASIFNHE